MSATDSIKVAVRVRPLLPQEIQSGNKTCLNIFHPISQIQIRSSGIDEAFTYNYVYGIKQSQEEVFSTSVKPLIPNLFKGYNVTVLAYGQTGSGKTYSMGTSCGTDGGSDDGVIPKSVQHIFDTIDKSSDGDYSVTVSFLELYNEQIRDLLQSSNGPVLSAAALEVREDSSGSVCIPGLTQVAVKDITETMACLTKGSQYRSTGATAMNKTSSRSHAVFTISIARRPNNVELATVAKFCLVDLAGSERAKKTQSTGDRFREGVNINMGLLALGNVISALGDDGQRRNHIPYRDSKLTRLLQDSLGGNSYTLMIACVSPAESNANESLNTLRYADRALKIKNKPVVNADPKAAEIGLLKSKLDHMTQLLTIERAKSVYRKCPPGHQRLIDIVRGELTREESSFTVKIKAASPRTKQHLRQVGIPLSEDEEEEEEDECLPGGLGDADVKTKSKPLFPQPPGLSPYNEEDEKEDVAGMENDYEQFQANLGSELEKVDLALVEKEALMYELTNSEDLEEKYAELLLQVKDLQSKKEELESTLQEMQKHNPKINANLAEQRRRMIKDLERKISDQKKQLSDLARLRQEKKRDCDRITGLNTEIQSLKQAKVRLTREIKKSADNYRSWKQRQDREVGRLQEAERKGRCQLDKQTKLHNRQQAVLQRKYQEAMASNKRMQAILQRRNNINTVSGQRSNAENTEKLHTWLDHELQVEKNLTFTRETLIQINEEVTTAVEKVKELMTAKYWEDPKSKNLRLNQTRELNDQIKLGRSQISVLESKLIGAENADVKLHHSRWAGVTNLNDARIMLNYLFNAAVSSDQEVQERNERVAELEVEKINLIESMSNLQATVGDMKNKLKEKEKEVTLSQSPSKLMKPPPGYVTPKSSSQDTRAQAVTTILKNRKKSLFANPGISDDEDDYEEEDEADHSENDPDWRYTPYVKEQNAYRRTKRTGSSDNGGVTKCSCKGKCNTKRCSCVKGGGSCADTCACLSEECQNRDSLQEPRQVPDLNSTFIFNSTPINGESTSSLKRESSDISDIESESNDIPKKRRLFVRESFE